MLYLDLLLDTLAGLAYVVLILSVVLSIALLVASVVGLVIRDPMPHWRWLMPLAIVVIIFVIPLIVIARQTDFFGVWA